MQITGTNQNELIFGTSGNDTINGGGGSDTLLGLDGDDIFIASPNQSFSTYMGGNGWDQVRTLDGLLRFNNFNMDNGIEWIGDYSTPFLSIYFSEGSTSMDFRNTLLVSTSIVNVFGTNGNDIIWGSNNSNNDYYYGGFGNDTIISGAGDVVMSGGAGNDVLIGNDGNDLFLMDGQGFDSVIGGNGFDVMNVDLDPNFGGSVASVRLASFNYENSIEAISTTMPGNSAPILFSFQDNPGEIDFRWTTIYAPWIQIEGTGGSDRILGSNVADMIFGSFGNDFVSGEDGNDILDGGAGDDTVMGGSGNDVIRMDSYNTSYSDRVFGGEGWDAIEVNSQNGVSFLTLNALNSTNSIEEIRIGNPGGTLAISTDNTSVDLRGMVINASIIQIEGTVGNDTIYGSSNNDVIFSGWGNDIVEGGSGNDTFIGGAGSDVMIGGDGNDIWRIDINDAINLNFGDNFLGGSGYDKIELSLNPAYTQAYLYMNSLNANNSIEDITVVGANTLLNLQFTDSTLVDLRGININNASMIQINAGITNDMVYGSNINDFIDGNIGNDTLIGGAGNDILYGGEGNDTYIINSGDGLDTIFDMSGTLDRVVLANNVITLNQFGASTGIERLEAANAAQIIVSGTSGDDSLNFSYSGFSMSGGTGSFRMDLGSGNDSVMGSIRADLMIGGDGNDSLNGGAAADNLQGGNGNDMLWGGLGNDVMTGTAGNDSLWGEAGNDTMGGGTGHDVLTGGDGLDVFRYFNNEGHDIITDFRGDLGDKLHISKVLQNLVGLSQDTSTGQTHLWFGPSGSSTMSIDIDGAPLVGSMALHFDFQRDVVWI